MKRSAVDGRGQRENGGREGGGDPPASSGTLGHIGHPAHGGPARSVADIEDFNPAFVSGRANLFETFTELDRNTNKTFEKCFALDSESRHNNKKSGRVNEQAAAGGQDLHPRAEDGKLTLSCQFFFRRKQRLFSSPPLFPSEFTDYNCSWWTLTTLHSSAGLRPESSCFRWRFTFTPALTFLPTWL